MIYMGMALFAVAWGLPHRRSMRWARTAAAGTGLGCSVLPLLFAVLLGAAMTSG